MGPEKPTETPDPNATPETPEVAPQTPEVPPESKPSEPATQEQVQQALKALADIKAQWEQKPTATGAQDVEKVREQIKEQTGWTDAQLDWHQNSLINAVAPLQEEVSWMRLERSHPDMSKYKDAMLKELSDGYSPAQRANPAILEKVYYLAKGRAMDNQPPTSRPTGDSPKPRIAPGYGGMGSGTDSGARPSASSLTDEQKEYARRLGVPEDAYKRSMATKNVRELKIA